MFVYVLNSGKNLQRPYKINADILLLQLKLSMHHVPSFLKSTKFRLDQIQAIP